MTTENQLEELAATLRDSMREGVDLNDPSLFRRLVMLLAEGRPVSPDRLAADLGRSREDVVSTLRKRLSIEWDAAGNVVGAGLTLNPTPHRFELKGRVLFTWCALDSLMFPGLIGETVQVQSPCASTGTPIRVTVTPQGVEQVEPPEAVVSLVTPEASADIRRVFCDYVNFFRSPDAALAWLAQHPGATILPVAEAYQVGRYLVEWNDNPDEEQG
jgi:alkylmercury lyase